MLGAPGLDFRDLGSFRLVCSERKFVEELRHMHRNPVRRGLVERPEDWKLRRSAGV
jgi:hypothetical protein